MEGTSVLGVPEPASGTRPVNGGLAGLSPFRRDRERGGVPGGVPPGAPAQHHARRGRSQALGRISAEQSADARPQRTGAAGRVRVFGDNGGERGQRAGPVVRRPPFYNGIERGSQRPQVRLGPAAFTTGPFGSDV